MGENPARHGPRVQAAWKWLAKTLSSISPALTALLVIAGWYVMNDLASAREVANQQRQMRVEYLLRSYRAFAGSVQRPPTPDNFRLAEAAVADVQLLGTPSQIVKVKAFMAEFERKDRAGMDPLLVDLRDELRRELGLAPLEDREIVTFRPEGIPTPIPGRD